jgi:hypothetical protein
MVNPNLIQYTNHRSFLGVPAFFFYHGVHTTLFLNFEAKVPYEVILTKIFFPYFAIVFKSIASGFWVFSIFRI